MMLVMEGRRLKLWWSVNRDAVGGVTVTVKDVLCVVEVRRVSNGVVAVVLLFEQGVLTLICGYAPHSGRILEENQFVVISLKMGWECIMWIIQLCALVVGHID